MKYAVQLYSLRHHMENGENFFDILKKVKDIGFDGVEFAGYHGYTAEEIKAKLDEYGLVAAGTHMGLKDLTAENLPATIKFCSTLGMNKIGIGGAPHKTLEEVTATSAVLKYAYDEAKKQGITIYYHNHCEEFHPLEDGRYPIDILKAACALQIDTYWSFYAGVDNYKFITENKDYITALHIKDGIDGTPKALGEGNNDLLAVSKAARDIGMEWVVLENDDPEPDGISDITRSMKYLKENF